MTDAPLCSFHSLSISATCGESHSGLLRCDTLRNVIYVRFIPACAANQASKVDPLISPIDMWSEQTEIRVRYAH